MLAASGTTISESGDNHYTINGNVSRLINWQDQRCTEEFIESLPKSDPPLSSGTFHNVICESTQSCLTLARTKCLEHARS